MVNVRWWLDALSGLYQQYGYLLVFLGTFGENTAIVGLLLPGSTLAVLGGIYARQGALNLAVVMVLAWCGTVVGYQLDYVLGRLLLVPLAGHLGATPFGRKLRLAARLRQAGRLLAKHGGKAILISHVIGHVRSMVALSAGMTHMRYRRFLGFELVAGFVWSCAYVLLGYWLGAQIAWLQPVIERSGWAIAGIIALAYVGWRVARPPIARHVRHRRQRCRASAAVAAVRQQHAQPRVRTTSVYPAGR